MLTPELYDRMVELFTAASKLPPDERDAFLDRECGDDASLREEVEAMLAKHAEPSDFLDTPALGADFRVPDAAAYVEPAGSLVGQRISHYEIKRIIATGGMGAVYEAEQEQPHRTVALKVMRYGIASPSALRRFEYEAEILARLQHEGIAQVYEAGTHGGPAEEGGVPFFAMEYIADARPITIYAREENLDTAARLALFLNVCDAVHHGHQKGIVHRDLKPGNILVDAAGQPKIIDFGVARATDADVAVTTMRTDVGQLIGTLQYMSPEQCAADPHDLDLRSDVYALGVILYELLCDQLPYDVSDAALHEAARVVQEAEPARPSTINRTLRGDLETITLKALEKERERRYESASELARDLRRYVDHEPIIARPPSAMYRLHKFVRRNRAMAAGLAVGFVVLVLWAITASWQASVARTAQRDAEIARDAEAEQRADAENARDAEAEQRTLAEQRERQTQRISNFQASMLSGINVRAMGRGIKDRFRESVQAALETEYVGEPPHRRQRTPEEIEAELATFDKLTESAQPTDVARQVMDEFVLARAANALERRFAEQPLVRAQLHFALGKTYSKLGVYDDAATHFRAALEIQREHHGPENVHVDVAVSLYNLAGLMHDMGDPTEAEALYRQSLAMWRELSNDVLVARTLEALGGMAIFQLRYPDADELLSEALRLNRELYGEDDVHSVANTLGSLAVLRTKQGRLPEAEDLNRQVLQMRRDHFGDEPHQKIALSLYNLAHVLMRQGRHEEAAESFREALAIQRAVHGNVHPQVAKTQLFLAGELVALGRRAEGEALYHQTLALQRELLGDRSPEVRATLEALAALSQQDGDHDQAVALRREALAIAEWRYPEGHPEAFRRYAAMGQLGRAMVRQAEALLSTDRQRALAVFEEAEALIIGSSDGQDEEERNRGLEFKGEREACERTAEMYEFWHNVAPDRGWDERAAEWRARLENLPEP